MSIPPEKLFDGRCLGTGEAQRGEGMTAADVIAIREQLQLSKSAFARAAEISREHLWRIENGKLPVGDQTAKKILIAAGHQVCPTCGTVLTKGA